MFAVFWKAVSNLADPAIRRLLVLSVLATVLTYALLVVLVGWGLSSSALLAVPWMETVVDVLGGLAAVLIAVLLFPGTISAFVGLFLDRVAEVVERRDYPHLPPPTILPLPQALLGAARFALVTVVANLLVLPLYLVPVVNLGVFALLNGYLISREYFELAALRRLPPAEVAAVRRRHRLRLWLLGAGLAGLLLIPGVNLVAPIIGVAMMVHVVQRLPSAAA